MPFTISHTVLAPFISKLSQNKLSIAPLAIGCMAPDLFRLFSDDTSLFSHHWQAILYPNLLIGWLFCVLWYVLYRNYFYSLLCLNDPIELPNLKSKFLFFIQISFGLILGNITHLLWDGLSHSDARTFIFADFLAQNIQIFHQTYPMHRVLQIGFSVVALPILFYFCQQYYRQYHVDYLYTKKMRQMILLSFIFVLGLSSIFTWWFIQKHLMVLLPHHLYFFIGKSFNQFAQMSLLFLSLVCCIFLFLQPKSKQSK